MGKRIGILSLTAVAGNPRVLRQAKFLNGLYEVTVFAPGPEPVESAEANVRFVELSPGVSPGDGNGLLHSGFRAGALFLGRANPSLYDGWYWQNPVSRPACDALTQNPCDLIVANGWEALAAASEAAGKTGARLIADFPDFSPSRSESLAFKAVQAPMVSYFIKKYARDLDGSITVSPGLAEMYRTRFGFFPVVVRNAPEHVTTPDHATDANRIHIIHHGGADRSLSDLIEIIRLCDRRFLLHYMLVGDQANIKTLKAVARKKAPNRVFFHETVKPGEVLSRIWRYDMSLVFQRPENVNELYTLPRKFFESIAAGLAVVAGPTPEMQDLSRRFRLGCVSASFSVKKVAEMLNALSAKDIGIMRAGAREAAKTLCAEKEHETLFALCEKIFSNGAEKAPEPLEEPAAEDEPEGQQELAGATSFSGRPPRA